MMATGRFYTVIRAIGSVIVHLFFRVRVIGRENIPNKGGYILCCNHTHFIDVAFLIVKIKAHICFMAKQELFKAGLVSRFLRSMGAFPVARGTGTGGTAAIHTAEKLVNSGNILGIFPEGTRSKDGRPKAAKSGVAVIANSTGADVLPISIFYEGKMRLFKKVTLNIGELISNEQLKMEEVNRVELKRVSGHIMDKIVSLWEAGHCK